MRLLSADVWKMRYRWLLLFVIFFTKKLPIPIYGQENLSGGRSDMGKSPHSGGEKPLFFLKPDPVSPERDTERRGRGDLRNRRRRENRSRGALWMGRCREKQGRQVYERSGLPLSLQRGGQACGRQVGRTICLLHRTADRRGDKRPGGLKAPRSGRCLLFDLPLRTGGTLQNAGQKKAPAGQGLSVRRRTAAGYDGCRSMMEQTGGGIPCFGVYPSEAGSFLRERR